MLTPILLACIVSQFNDAQPEKAKAVITDQYGQPLPLERSEFGLLVISARKSVHDRDNPESVKWTVLPAEYNARKWVPNDDGLEFGIALEGQPVDIVVILSVASKDGSVDHLLLTVKCGKGPIPPPGPKPGPNPTPEPKASKVKLVVIEDALNRKPDTAIALNDRVFWDGLKPTHSYVIYDHRDTTKDGANYAKLLMSRLGLNEYARGAAYVGIFNADTGELLDVLSLDQDMQQLKDKFKSITAR